MDFDNINPPWCNAPARTVSPPVGVYQQALAEVAAARACVHQAIDTPWVSTAAELMRTELAGVESILMDIQEALGRAIAAMHTPAAGHMWAGVAA